MGKRDMHMHSLPVDKYRKSIGIQNKKKTTGAVRTLKKNAEVKSTAPKIYQDVKVMLGGFAGFVMLVYALLYIWLVKDTPE